MYIIQEMQTTGNATALVTPVTRENRNEAESVFHQALAAAAVSGVEIHTVILYDEHGNVLMRQFYEHTTAPSAT